MVIEKMFEGKLDPFGRMEALPEEGLKAEKLLEGLREMRGEEKEYKTGKAFGGIYYDWKKKELKEAINSAYSIFSDSNGLYPRIFPALRKFEMECVRMAASLLNGDEETTGMMCSGGTESILMAIRSAKKIAEEKGVSKPELVAPCTAHPAFAKGCEYFGLKLVEVEVDNEGQISMKEYEKLVNENTALLVASAPNFSQGAVEPIEEIGKLALKYSIPFHVDACLGGFLLPFLNEMGLTNSKFDFSVEGVTSISTDIHKYGFAPLIQPIFKKYVKLAC